MAFHEIKIGSKNFTLAPKYVKGPETAESTDDYGFLLFRYDEDDSSICKLYSPGGYDLPLIKYSSGNIDIDCKILPAQNDIHSVGASNRKFNAMYATTFYGNLSGNATSATDATNATNATNVNITTSNTSSNYPLVFTSSVTAGNKRLYTDTANELHYNPNTKTLTTTTFNGTATNATNVNVKTSSENINYPLVFTTSVTAGNKVLATDTANSLHYNPSTNVLTAPQVDAKLNGPVQTTGTSTDASYYISFVNMHTTGMRYSYVNSSLYYNPSTNTLTTTKFKGNLEGNADSANKVLLTPQKTTGDYPIIYGQSDSVTSTSVKSVHVDANLTFNPSTNILTTTQVNAKLYGPVQTTGTSTDASYYISFVNMHTTGMRYSYVNSSLYYNPNTKTLTTTNFNGTATNATYINVASASNTNASYYIQFVNATTGNKKSYTDSHLLYNPGTNILTAQQVDTKLNGPIYTYVAGTNLSYYITFVNGSTAGMRYSYVDSNLIYNPSTNTLTAGKFVGYIATKKGGSWSTSAHNGEASVVNDHTGSGGALVCLASMTAKDGRITIGTIPRDNSYFYFSYHKTGNTSVPDKQMIWDYQANTLSTSGGFYETSDERLKDLQEDIEVNFSYLHNIPKKYYSWKDDSTYTRHIGTSAQEVQKYYPELVNTGDDGYLTMNYDKLSIVALKAIDVLHEEVTELKKENAELKERLARLEELILNR